MSKKDFELIKPALLAIPKEQVMLPRIPIDTFLQEANDLYVWAKDDEKALRQVGLEKQVLSGLPTQIGALQYTQSIWNSERTSQSKLNHRWEELRAEGRALRKELKLAFRFAFRKDRQLAKKLKLYGKGRTYADLIQDLSDLALLGQSNLSKLKMIGFDPVKLKAAEELCFKMTSTLAKRNAYGEAREIKSLRDRTYTHLYVTLNEVRTAGRYAFRGQPDKLVGYRLRYQSRKKPAEVIEPPK